MSKDDIIRFRCEGDLRARFSRVASLLRREEPDLARIIFEDFVAQEENKLGLTHYRLSDKPATPPAPPAAPVTYRKPKLKPDAPNSTPAQQTAEAQIVAAVAQEVSYRKSKRKKSSK